VASGAFASLQQGVEAMVHPSGRVDPDSANVDAYERKYRRYRAAVDSLASFWTVPC
jgi:ribulose kinase